MARGVTQKGPHAGDNEPCQKSSLVVPVLPSFGSTSSSTPNTEGMSLAPALPVQVGAGRGWRHSQKLVHWDKLRTKMQVIALGFALKVQVCLPAVCSQTTCLLQKGCQRWGWAQHCPGAPGRCISSSSGNLASRGDITAQHQHPTSCKGWAREELSTWHTLGNQGACTKTDAAKQLLLKWGKFKYFLSYGILIQHSTPSFPSWSFPTSHSLENPTKTLYCTYLHLFPS